MYTLVDVHTSNAHIYGYSILMAFGSGLTQQVAYSAAPAIVGHLRAADAVGYINASQIGSIVIALTITSTIFQNIGFSEVQRALQGDGFSAVEIHAALAGAKSTVFETVSSEVKQNVVEAIVKAIGEGYILVIVAGAVLVIASLLMKREKLFMEVTAGG